MKKILRVNNKAIYLFCSMMTLLMCVTLVEPFVNGASYEIEYSTLARNVDKGIPSGEPVFITDSGLGAVFLTTDSYVYSYIRFKEIRGPFILTTEWYSPEGQLFASTMLKEETSESYSELWTWSRIPIAGNINEEQTGLWTVKVYFNDELITVSKFVILTPYQAWRFIEVYGEMKEANQALQDSLNMCGQKLQESDSEIALLESKNHELENNLMDAKAKYDALSKEHSKLVTEINTLQEKLNNTRAELDNLSLQRLTSLLVAIVSASIAIIAIVVKRKKA